jgi:hypothetical protein
MVVDFSGIIGNFASKEQRFRLGFQQSWVFSRADLAIGECL